MIGFLNIYKPSGMTSSNVVVKLRKKFHISKIGHFGTLDPMAEGVLPIAIGKATRMFDYYLAKYKTYIATFQFGYITDTLDSEGKILDTTDNIPNINDIKLSITKFLGKQAQIPPSFSAKLVNGIRAYKLARSGETVELKPKEIEVTKFDLLENCGNATYKFKITCSSGTYIRAIARDLGEMCKSYCTMTALQRVESGVFNLSNSIKLEDALNLDNIENCLLGLSQVFPNMQLIDLSKNDFDKIKNGVAIENIYDVKDIAFSRYNNKIIGVVEKKEKGLLKIKTFLME